MKALIICPADRKAVAALARRRPLALTPYLGQPVLGQVLGFLASAGAREVMVLAAAKLVLNVDVQAGNLTASEYAQPTLWGWLEKRKTLGADKIIAASATEASA